MTYSVLGGGFIFKKTSIGGSWTWKVISDNISNYGQTYYVSDINTPFGKYETINSPIPSDVILSMSESINSLQSQLQSILSVLGSSSRTITLSEGGFISNIEPIQIYNNGALGSFLNVSATSSNQSVVIPNPEILGINKNEIRNVNLYIDPKYLLSSQSPYTILVNLQNSNDLLNQSSVTYTVNVLPRPSISINTNSVNFTYTISTNSITYDVNNVVITNNGPNGSLLSVMMNKIKNVSPWLSMNANISTDIPSNQNSTLTFNIDASKINKIPASYEEVISIASVNAVNSPLSVYVKLTVV